jgi:hypothetical protein
MAAQDLSVSAASAAPSVAELSVAAPSIAELSIAAPSIAEPLLVSPPEASADPTSAPLSLAPLASGDWRGSAELPHAMAAAANAHADNVLQQPHANPSARRRVARQR